MAEILVVDDESSMRFLLRITFESEGHRVEEAPNGLAAVERIEGGRLPDLVATDFMMPLLNGGELIARLRRNPATTAIPIVLISASPGAEREHGGGRVLPQAVRPGGARCMCRGAAREGRVDAAATTGDAGLDLVLGGGLPPASLSSSPGRRGAGRRSSRSRSLSRTRPRSGRRSTTRPGRSRTTSWCATSSRSAFFDVEALGERVEFVHLAELIAERGRRIRAAADEIVRQSSRRSRPSS